MTHLTSHTFSSRKHRSIVVQEIAPVMDVAPMGHLIADIAYYHGLVLATIAKNLAQSIVHRDTNGSHALTLFQEQTIELRILNGMIDLPTLNLGC